MFEVPPAWEKIDFSAFRGTISVVGAPDTGKSTFIQFLSQKLRAANRPTALLDGDPGQNSLGPPAALTLLYEQQTWHSFTGSTSPVGHMLEVVVGTARLARAAFAAGAEAVLHDTCGFIDANRGGAALKLALIDLLRPEVVFAIQRHDELEPLLAALRRSRRTQVVDLQAAPAARRRSIQARQDHRRRSFARYFSGAGSLQVDLDRLALLPGKRPRLGRLSAFEDAQGFALSLGILTRIDAEARRLTLLTPQPSLKQVTALHLGDLEVDTETYRDRIISSERA